MSDNWGEWWTTCSTDPKKVKPVTVEDILAVKKELERIRQEEEEIMKRKVIKMESNTPPEPVMSDDQKAMRASFEQSIIDELFEDANKLIFADWLTDQGFDNYALLVRFAVDQKVWPYSWVEKYQDGEMRTVKWAQRYSWWSHSSDRLYQLTGREKTDPSNTGFTVYNRLKAKDSGPLFEDRKGYDSLYVALWDYRQATEWVRIKPEYGLGTGDD